LSPLVFAVVLLAAVLHASWNALVKSGGDPYLRLAIVNLTHSIAVLPLLPFVGFPAAEAWPWLLGSVATHLAYYLFLAAGYRSAISAMSTPSPAASPRRSWPWARSLSPAKC
jgi:hypothetical protein